MNNNRIGVLLIALAAIFAGVLVAVQPASAATVLKVNFGASVSGWDTDMGSDYTASRGYGWVDSQPAQCFVRRGSTSVQDTICRAESRYLSGSWRYAPATWKADLAPGVYDVTIGWGDSAVSHTNVIAANGVAFVDAKNNKSNPSASRTVTVDSSGVLTLTFGNNRNDRTALNYVQVDSTTGGATTTTTQAATTTTQAPTTVTTQAPTTTQATTIPTTPPSGPNFSALPSGVTLVDSPIIVGTGGVVSGEGMGVTILKPSAAFPAGQPMIQTASLTGDGNGDFTINNLTVDCANVCDGVRVHGYRYKVDNLEVRNSAGPGFHTSWKQEAWASAPQGGGAMEAQISNLRVQNSGTPTESQVIIAGPNDSVFRDVFISSDVWHTAPAVKSAVYISGQGFGTVMNQVHYWGRGHDKGIIVAPNVTGVRLDGYFEGARTAEVVFEDTNRDSAVFGQMRCWGHDFAPNVQGLVLGPNTTGLRVDVQMSNCINGGLVFNGAEAGAISMFDLVLWQSPTTGTAPASAVVRTAS